MVCVGCQREAGFNRCGQWCLDCLGGPIRTPDARGPIPFMSVPGWPFGNTKRSRMTQAYYNDIRSRRIDRSHGVKDAVTGLPYAKTYRDEGRKGFSYAGQGGRS